MSALPNNTTKTVVTKDQKEEKVTRTKYDPTLPTSIPQYVDISLTSEEEWQQIRAQPPPFPFNYYTGRGVLPKVAHQSFSDLQQMPLSAQLNKLPRHHFLRINALPRDFPFKRFPIHYQGEKVVLYADLAACIEQDRLSDYANEPARICSSLVEAQCSAHQVWLEQADTIIQDAATYEPNQGLVHTETLRSSLRQVAPLAPRFRCTAARAYMQFFQATNVLDPCAGWGDRLVGALSLGVRYTGVDPNSKVHEGYQQLIENFAEDPQKYHMICKPIQAAEADIAPFGPYDLVFTSPPFFDREIYSEEKTQSMYQVTSVQQWLQTFMYPLLEVCSKHLSPGGFLALSINDFAYHLQPRHTYCAEILTYAVDHMGLRYVGCVPFYGFRKDQDPSRKPGSPQPVWVLQKRSNDFFGKRKYEAVV